MNTVSTTIPIDGGVRPNVVLRADPRYNAFDWERGTSWMCCAARYPRASQRRSGSHFALDSLSC
jgi:hypothetical protein